MANRVEYEAVIVGSGPNGLAAAIRMAQAGRSTLVLEAADSVGGGTRTAELTLPGFQHDLCAAILPLAVASPFLTSLPLAKYGLRYIYPPAALAHPLEEGPAVLLEDSVETTAGHLGKDASAYRRLMDRLVRDCDQILDDFLGPFPFPPKHLVASTRFGIQALWPATAFARTHFAGTRARALFAGLGAHAIQPLEHLITASFALVEGMIAHTLGWPLVSGGTHHLTQAMTAYLEALGGEVRTGTPVRSLEDLPPARVVLFDLTPRQLLQIAGQRLPAGYQNRLGRYRYGPGVFKIDYALDGPIPWKDPACARAATVHLGGTLEEISASERAVWKGEHPERPFVLLAQQSLFDPTRAPAGKHTAWVYCHVPNGSTLDMTARIERQIERFAPGFRDCVAARHVMNSADMQDYNANYIGGDINGGVQDLGQLFTRPVARRVPYSTPVPGLFLCSSSTPPGGGVHGMAGFHAAQAALKHMGAGL